MTPLWACSACLRRMRMIPSGRCGWGFGSWRPRKTWWVVGGAPLRVRVGINTGEALVRLGSIPGSGEGFLTGDAINTASRLQGVAPEMGVAVGLATYEATATVFEYRSSSPSR